MDRYALFIGVIANILKNAILQVSGKNQLQKLSGAVGQSTATHNAKASFAVKAVLFKQQLDFVVDSGAELLILPPADFEDKAIPIGIQLTAVNGIPTKTYDYLQTTIAFPLLRRSYEICGG